MITIILALALGVLFTSVGIQNSQVVNLNLFGNLFTFPLYIFLAFSFLAGTIISGIFSVFDWTGAVFDIKKKENNYNNIVKVNEELQKDIQKVTNENVKLKEELTNLKSEYQQSKNIKRKENIKNFIARITHPNSPSADHIS